MLRDPKVIFYLNMLQGQYVMCPIDKAANSIAFICKNYYVQVLLKENRFIKDYIKHLSTMNDTLHNNLQQQK